MEVEKLAKIISRVPMWDIAKKLIEIGMISKEQANNISRIVIDLDANKAAIMYIQYYGEDSVMSQLPDMISTMFGGKDGRTEGSTGRDVPGSGAEPADTPEHEVGTPTCDSGPGEPDGPYH